MIHVNKLNNSQSFSDSEYDSRWVKLREAMGRQDVQALLVTSPENIYYLVGLNHQGYFAFTMLIVPRKGEAIIVARAHEQATINAQVQRARHVGFKEDDDPAASVTESLRELRLDSARIGIEKDHMFLPPDIAERIQADLPLAEWVDASGAVEKLRLVKSRAELAYTRQAAEISDKAMSTAIETARAGVNEKEIAMKVYETMIDSGGDYPGFVPFIRTNETIPLGHATWRDRVLQNGDVLFIELSGCVRRYHAPIIRQIYIGEPHSRAIRAEPVAIEAHQALFQTLEPGVVGGEVYAAWQNVVDDALGHKSTKGVHCGYTVGIGFPPSWVGGSTVVGLRPNGTLLIKEGMVFHLLTWLNGSDIGDYALSDTAIVTTSGCEVLTSVIRSITVK